MGIDFRKQESIGFDLRDFNVLYSKASLRILKLEQKRIDWSMTFLRKKL